MSSQPDRDDEFSSSPAAPFPTPLKPSTNLQAWRSGMGSGRFTVDGGGGSQSDEMNATAFRVEGSLPIQMTQHASMSLQSTPMSNYPNYQHLHIPFTQPSGMSYHLEGPSSAPSNFGWPGVHGDLNFASMPSSPVVGFGISDLAGRHQSDDFSSSVPSGHHSPASSQPATRLINPHTQQHSSAGQLLTRTGFSHNDYTYDGRHQSMLTSQKPGSDLSHDRLGLVAFDSDPISSMARDTTRVDVRVEAPRHHPTYSSPTVSSNGACSSPTESHLDIQRRSKPAMGNGWDTQKIEVNASISSTNAAAGAASVVNSDSSGHSDSRPQTANASKISPLTVTTTTDRTAKPSEAPFSIHAKMALSNAKRIPISSADLAHGVMVPSSPHSRRANSNIFKPHLPLSGSSTSYSLPGGTAAGNPADMENPRVRSGWYPFREPVSSDSPQSSTESSFSTCTSPSSPFSPPWLLIQQARGESLHSPIYSRLPFAQDGPWQPHSLIQPLKADPTTSHNAFEIELWKMYGSAQEITPTNDALEQLVERLREMGLNVEEIRKQWNESRRGSTFTVGDDEDDRHSDRTAYEHQLSAGAEPDSSVGVEREITLDEDAKLVKADKNNSKSEDDLTPHKAPADGQGPDDKSCPSSVTPVSSVREPSIERGRRTRTARRTVPYLDAALQADSDGLVEMDWRTHSRSRSRPPETTNMDWRQTSRSRTRRPGRPVDYQQHLPPGDSNTGPNTFFTSHAYKPLETAVEDQREGSSTLRDQPSGLLGPFSDFTSSGSLLGSVDERSDKFRLFDSSSSMQNGYYDQEFIEKIMGEMNQANEFALNSQGGSHNIVPVSEQVSDAPAASASMAAHYLNLPSRLPGLDFGMLGLPSTPSHSSLLGSIPGLTQDFAKVANAHAEYGSIPRVVRKTSFDETLVQQNLQSMLQRQSHLGPRSCREQGSFSNANTGRLDSIDIGRDQGAHQQRPSTAVDAGRRLHQILSLHASDAHEGSDHPITQASSTPFESSSCGVPLTMGQYISQIDSVTTTSSGDSAEYAYSLPGVTSMPTSNGTPYEYVTSQSFQNPSMRKASMEDSGIPSSRTPLEMGGGARWLPAEQANSANHSSVSGVATHPVASAAALAHPHSHMYNNSFGTRSTSSLDGLSDYDLWLRFGLPCDDQGNHPHSMNSGAFVHSEPESLSLLDSPHPLLVGDRLAGHTSAGPSALNHRRLSEIRPLMGSNPIPPVTINPAQLHSTPLREPSHLVTKSHANGRRGDNLLYPSSGRSFSGSSSSGSSDSSRASSFSSATVTAHQTAGVRTSQATAGPSTLSPLRMSMTSNVSTALLSTSEITSNSKLAHPVVTQDQDSMLINWNGTSGASIEGMTQDFSGGRSTHARSIGEARKRSKQLPYGLTLSVSGGGLEGEHDERFVKNTKTVSNGMGFVERPASTVVREDSKPDSNPVTASTTVQCLNCKTTETPLWRRDGTGKPLCNACGLFLNLHGIPRPAALSTGVIKRRNRAKHSEKSGSGGNKKKVVKARALYVPVQPSAGSPAVKKEEIQPW